MTFAAGSNTFLEYGDDDQATIISDEDIGDPVLWQSNGCTFTVADPYLPFFPDAPNAGLQPEPSAWFVGDVDLCSNDGADPNCASKATSITLDYPWDDYDGDSGTDLNNLRLYFDNLASTDIIEGWDPNPTDKLTSAIEFIRYEITAILSDATSDGIVIDPRNSTSEYMKFALHYRETHAFTVTGVLNHGRTITIDSSSFSDRLDADHYDAQWARCKGAGSLAKRHPVLIQEAYDDSEWSGSDDAITIASLDGLQTCAAGDTIYVDFTGLAPGQTFAVVRPARIIFSTDPAAVAAGKGAHQYPVALFDGGSSSSQYHGLVLDGANRTQFRNMALVVDDVWFKDGGADLSPADSIDQPGFVGIYDVPSGQTFTPRNWFISGGQQESQDFTTDFGTSTSDITFANAVIHSSMLGTQPATGPYYLTSTTSLPTGLEVCVETDPCFLRFTSQTVAKVYANEVDARNNQNPITFSDDGTGTHTATGVPFCWKDCWQGVVFGGGGGDIRVEGGASRFVSDAMFAARNPAGLSTGANICEYGDSTTKLHDITVDRWRFQYAGDGVDSSKFVQTAECSGYTTLSNSSIENQYGPWFINLSTAGGELHDVVAVAPRYATQNYVVGLTARNVTTIGGFAGNACAYNVNYQTVRESTLGNLVPNAGFTSGATNWCYGGINRHFWLDTDGTQGTVNSLDADSGWIESEMTDWAIRNMHLTAVARTKSTNTNCGQEGCVLIRMAGSPNPITIEHLTMGWDASVAPDYVGQNPFFGTQAYLQWSRVGTTDAAAAAAVHLSDWKVFGREYVFGNSSQAVQTYDAVLASNGVSHNGNGYDFEAGQVCAWDIAPTDDQNDSVFANVEWPVFPRSSSTPYVVDRGSSCDEGGARKAGVYQDSVPFHWLGLRPENADSAGVSYRLANQYLFCSPTFCN